MQTLHSNALVILASLNLAGFRGAVELHPPIAHLPWVLQAIHLGALLKSQTVTTLAWLHLLTLDLWQARHASPAHPVAL